MTDLLINEPARPEGSYAVTWLRDLAWDPNANKILIGIMPPSAPYHGVWEMNLDGSKFRKSSFITIFHLTFHHFSDISNIYRGSLSSMSVSSRYHILTGTEFIH
jgi:hypothetical protein